ncbi:hypothetical protein Mapa_004624 [Marchantia paleacea]|nr:hypothetical protein Mapa_004624 [Marchantia paleacea]
MRCGVCFPGVRGQYSIFSSKGLTANSFSNRTFVGAGVRRLFIKQSSFGGAARMASTVNDSQDESSPQTENYMFGQWKIDSKEVFLVTEHCYAFVNLRPVVPGHILTSTIILLFLYNVKIALDHACSTKAVGGLWQRKVPVKRDWNIFLIENTQIFS